METVNQNVGFVPRMANNDAGQVTVEQSADYSRAFKEWASRPQDERYSSLEDLWAACNSRRERSRSDVYDIRGFELESKEGGIAINHRGGLLVPTNYGFGAMARRIGMSRSFAEKLTSETLTTVFREQLPLQERQEDKLLIVDCKDGRLSRLQTVTSEKYTRVWDADLVAMVQRIQETVPGLHLPPAWKQGGQLGGEITTGGAYASDHDCFIFMIDGGSLLEAPDGKELHRGFYAWNSEVGDKTVGFSSFYFRKCCGNHIISGGECGVTIKMKHTSTVNERIQGIIGQIGEYMQSSPQEEQRQIQAAYNAKLPEAKDPKEFTRELQSLAVKAKANFTNQDLTHAVAFAKAEEGACETVWQLVQGLTAYARTIDWVDKREALEREAGKLLAFAA